MLGFRTPIECHIRDKLAEAEGGRTEVAAGHGYADVVTDTHVIEVKHVRSIRDAYHAIGQAKGYVRHISNGKLHARAHVFGAQQTMRRLMSEMEAYSASDGVLLTHEEIPDGPLVNMPDPTRHKVVFRASDGMVHLHLLATSIVGESKKNNGWGHLKRTDKAKMVLVSMQQLYSSEDLVTPPDKWNEVFADWRIAAGLICVHEASMQRHFPALLMCAVMRRLPDDATLRQIEKDLREVIDLRWVDDTAQKKIEGVGMQ